MNDSQNHINFDRALLNLIALKINYCNGSNTALSIINSLNDKLIKQEIITNKPIMSVKIPIDKVKIILSSYEEIYPEYCYLNIVQKNSTSFLDISEKIITNRY